MPSTLVGVAVIGKRNEPLYMCDCARFEPGTGDAENTAANTSEDPFGFARAAQQGPIHLSLPVQHQFLFHAAIDKLDEMIDTTTTRSAAEGKIPSGMAVRRVPPKPTWGVHWLGLLETFGCGDDDWRVYGHITATNVKFLALTRGKPDPAKVRDFLVHIHSGYIGFTMNPFSPVRELEIIDSPKFNASVKQALYDYEQKPEC